jgi:Peptidase family M1 domain
MDQQPDITRFQAKFNGPFPATTDGIVVGRPNAGFEEEMQGKITFEGGTIDLDTFVHENMHQWFGDNVSEDQFRDTFWKEGWATVGEALLAARIARAHAGGPGTPKGDAAFDRSLIRLFGQVYAAGRSFWTVAPSNPTVGTLFGGANTYVRPMAAYLALRQILGATASRPDSDRWIKTMKDIQRRYGGASITEAQLEAAFQTHMPTQSPGCAEKLRRFFAQWFDTAYASGGGANRPRITGPGLPGPDHFYKDGTACALPPSTAPGSTPRGLSAPENGQVGPVPSVHLRYANRGPHA